YVGCVAEAALLAASDPGSVGEAYNITDQGPITQRDYLNLWAEACGAQPIKAKRSYPVVFAVASLVEAYARLRRQPKPPFITRYATWLMGRDLAYSSAKAKGQLGWSPTLSYRESIERTVHWYLGQGATPTTPGTLKAGQSIYSS
ncbi:MAG: hypothetical protein ABI353_15615, partial [Isosphaeraceae bacterium]